MRTINMDGFIDDPEDMGLCPICEYVINAHKPVDIIIAHGCKALAHKICVDDEMEEDE